MKSIYTIAFLVLFVGQGMAQKKALVLNLTKDATYSQVMVSNVTIVQSVQEQDIKINMSISGKMSMGMRKAAPKPIKVIRISEATTV